MEQGVRAYMQQSRIFVGMVLILIFGEVLGLYGYVTSRETCAVQTTHTFQSHRGAYSEHQEQGLIWLILTCNIRKWRQADMESNHASCKNQWPLYILCPISRLLLLPVRLACGNHCIPSGIVAKDMGIPRPRRSVVRNIDSHGSYSIDCSEVTSTIISEVLDARLT